MVRWNGRAEVRGHPPFAIKMTKNVPTHLSSQIGIKAPSANVNLGQLCSVLYAMALAGPDFRAPVVLRLRGCGRAGRAFLVHGKLIDPSGATMSTAPIQLQTNAGVLVAETTSSITGVSDFVAVKAGAHTLKVPAYNGFEAMAVPILMATQVQNMGSVKDIQALLRHLRADITANEYMQALPETVQEMVGSRNFFRETRFGD
jgi:hypothetical protein